MRRWRKCDRRSITHSIWLVTKFSCSPKIVSFWIYELWILLSTPPSHHQLSIWDFLSFTKQVQIINRSTNRLNLNEIWYYFPAAWKGALCILGQPNLKMQLRKNLNNLKISQQSVQVWGNPLIRNSYRLTIKGRFYRCCAKRSFLSVPQILSTVYGLLIVKLLCHFNRILINIILCGERRLFIHEVMKLNFGLFSENIRHGFQSTKSKLCTNDSHISVWRTIIFHRIIHAKHSGSENI